MLMTQSHSLPPAKQFLMNCNDVEGSVPLSSTSEAVLMNCNDVEGSDPSPLVKLKTQTLSTGEIEDSGSLHW